MIDIKEERQEIVENGFLEDIRFVPNQVKNWFINNVVSRTLAHLVGYTSNNEAKVLRCSSSGVLLVSSSGSGYEHNETFTGTSADAYGLDITPTVTASKFTIWAKDNAIVIRRSNDLVIWEDEITVPKGGIFEEECSTARIGIRSAVGGVHSDYQVIYWY